MKLKETEGTPTVQSEEYWMKEFRQQRKDRLQDSVDEYMQDGEINDFYKDLTDAIQSLIDYHEKQKGYAVTAMKAVSGHRPLQMQQNKPPGPAVDEEGRQLTEDEYFKWKYNLAEADYYDKRAKLDIEHSKYYWDKDRNKPDAKADGYSVTDYKEIPDRY